jgi:hypothetical protein
MAEPPDLPPTAALDDLIQGRGVRRGRHPLGPDERAAFLRRLGALGFSETTVGAVAIEVGERVPAWVVRENVADFGMVFWEVFTEVKKLKLFASVARNAKGDWDVMIRAGSPERLFAAPGLLERYDPSRPVGMF